jgi:hypothetical protein
VLLDHIDPEKYQPVLSAMSEALTAWLRCRDGVAAASGISRD